MIILKGMDMPTKCNDCFCWNCEHDNQGFAPRPPACPLVPVPPHGRLIDADALIDDVRKHSESYFADDFAHEWVDKAPTIVPPEEEPT